MATDRRTEAETAAADLRSEMMQFHAAWQEAIESMARLQQQTLKLFEDYWQDLLGSFQTDPKLEAGQRLLEEWEAEHGELGDDELEDVRARWPA